MGEIGDHCRGFLGGASDKEAAWQCRRCKTLGFDPWVRKISGGGQPSSIYAWRIPRTEEPGGPQSTGSQIVWLSMHACCKQMQGYHYFLSE